VAFVFLHREVVLAIHEEQLAQHGGGVGIRDEGLLDSALARPVNRANYDPDTDCATLAADYAFGLAKNHPFIDGNKRTAFVAMVLCLALNGFQLIASDEDAVIVMLQLAAGGIGEEALAIWIRGNIVSLPDIAS
jgi:death-on-curing protein